MSTRVTFDLDGLRRAIESGDAHYRTALYADGAELRIVDSGQPAHPTQVLQGRSAIADWIQSMYGTDDIHRVLESAAEGGQIRVVEERETADGVRLVYAAAAEVDRGQIIRETAVLTQQLTPANRRPKVISPGPDASAPDGTAGMIEQSSRSTPYPAPHWSSSGTAVARHVPGYYLG